jgi:hypothetical protein
VAQPTLVRNNRAFAQISVPFNALALKHYIYVAAGPFEPFIKKREFVPVEDPVGEARDHWNHREFGFSDHGSRYFIKVTTETVGPVETSEISSPRLEIPRTRGDESIPIVLAMPSPMPTTITALAAAGDFIISVRDFATFRLIFDVVVPDGAIEFRVDTARKRAGPFTPHQVSTNVGSGIVSLDTGLFQIKSTGVASLDIDVRESAFVQLRVRENGGTAGNKVVNSIDIERLGRVPNVITAF